MAAIVAEFCQNHKGDREIMKRMIHQAAEAGADYAKIQTIHSDFLTYRERFEDGRVEAGTVKVIKRPYQPEYERLKAMDIDREDHLWFVGECKRAGIRSMTTVFARKAVADLASMAWDAIKVASYDCASFPLIRDIKAHFDRVFVSTGSTFDDEIRNTAGILEGWDFALLHCVTIYPTPLNALHLNRMAFLRQFAPKVGFSDHTLVARDGIKAAAAALHQGADVIERHFTVLDPTETKDGPVSIGPELLRQLVRLAHAGPDELADYVNRNIPEYPQMLGEKQRPLSHEELLNRDYYRGRFASKLPDGSILYNWEDKPLVPDPV